MFFGLLRILRRADGSGGWSRPSGSSTIVHLFFAVLFTVLWLWAFPLRPGWSSSDAVVQDYMYKGRYAATLVVEFEVGSAPKSGEVAVSRRGAPVFFPIPEVGTTVPVVHNETGSSVRYTGAAAWVESVQLFIAAAVSVLLAVRARRHAGEVW